MSLFFEQLEIKLQHMWGAIKSVVHYFWRLFENWEALTDAEGVNPP